MTEATFAGRTVVVTGGAGGLGRAMVAAFVARGARVVSADLSVADESATRDGVIARWLDVTSEESWLALIAFVEHELAVLTCW